MPRFETLAGGTRVYVDQHHRFGSDGLLLAGFCHVNSGESLCELGAGCGLLAFTLFDRGFRGRLCLVELSAQACGLLKATAAYNGAENAEIYCTDLRRFKTARPFSLVVFNPPYFSGGPLPAGEERALARHTLEGSLADWCAAARSLLKDKGRLCLCYPPQGLPSLMAGLCQNRLAPRKLQFVKNRGKKEPWLCLVEAVKPPGCKPFHSDGLRILPEIILEQCEY